MRLAEHERLVARGMWLKQQDTHKEPPAWGDVLGETFEALANRCEVIDNP